MWGISKRRTSLGWNVIRIHYSADPAKDPRSDAGAKWLAEAKKGVPEARWRKEFEMDYGALGGQLCFPTFDETKHVVQPFKIDPAHWTVYLACDPHPRTAHAFLWLAVNKHGRLVVPWTWWREEANRDNPFVTANYVETIDAFHAVAPQFTPTHWLMDVAGKGFGDEKEDYFQKYQKCGLTFQPAKRDRQEIGIDLINEVLQVTQFDETQIPKLTIMDGAGENGELIQELKSLRFREARTSVTDKDPPEEPEQKRRHLVDCLIYCLLAEPEFIPAGRPRDTFKPLYKNLGY